MPETNPPRWLISNYGDVDAENTIWLRCEGIAERDAMKVEQTITLAFNNGPTRSVAEVTRIV